LHNLHNVVDDPEACQSVLSKTAERIELLPRAESRSTLVGTRHIEVLVLCG